MDATPLRMTTDVIREAVQKNRLGAYILGNEICGRFVFKYVGRSDYCLQTRLLTHGRLYYCPYFVFFYTDTAKEAFELESKWWHDCINTNVQLINHIHPDAPSGMGLVCPYCQFSHAAKEYVQLLSAS